MKKRKRVEYKPFVVDQKLEYLEAEKVRLRKEQG